MIEQVLAITPESNANSNSNLQHLCADREFNRIDACAVDFNGVRQDSGNTYRGVPTTGVQSMNSSYIRPLGQATDSCGDSGPGVPMRPIPGTRPPPATVPNGRDSNGITFRRR